jgi:alpha-1,6-mannosyltransferase
MKLVDVCEFYTESGGGVRTYIHQKLAASALAGIDCTILAPGPEDRIEPREGGRIQYLKSPRHFIDARYHVFKDSSPVFAALDAIDPDVVEGSSAWRGGELAAAWPGPAARAFFIHQDPVAVYGHTILGRVMSFDAVDRLAGGLWRHLSRLAARYDVSVVSGEWLAERLARMGLPKPFAAPFGIEKSVFSPRFRDEALRLDMLRQGGCDDPDGLLLIAVSRYHPEKRIGMLIDAFEAVRAERPAALWVIGHGPIRRWVEGRARRAAGVHLSGPIWDRQKLAATLASADVFLHGGAAETFGLAVAEGLASGLPLIVPDLGGASDLAGPGYAISYRAGNAAACADAMRAFLARDRAALRASAIADGAAKLREPKAHFDDLFALYARLPRRAALPA